MLHNTYVRRNRRQWSLSQEELARLLGISQTRVSRCESSEVAPEIEIALGLQVIFGRSPRALFPGLYGRIEEAVMAMAAEMDRQLEGKKDRISLRKRELLAHMSRRSQGYPPAE